MRALAGYGSRPRAAAGGADQQSTERSLSWCGDRRKTAPSCSRRGGAACPGGQGVSGVYEPVRVPRRPTRRGMLVALVLIVASLVAVVVTVVRTMPHPPPVEPLTLDEFGRMVVPDAAQTELLVTMVRAR